jgi:uncharacterized caspase-like protein
MLSLIVAVHNLYLRPAQADPSSPSKKSENKSIKDPKPKSETVRDTIKDFTDGIKPKSTTTSTTTDPKPTLQSNTVRNTIVGVTGTTNPLTTATTNPITKTTITDPPSQVRSLIPPIAKNIISNVVVSTSQSSNINCC